MKKLITIISDWLLMMLLVFGIGGTGVTAGLMLADPLGISHELSAALFGALGAALGIKLATSTT